MSGTANSGRRPQSKAWKRLTGNPGKRRLSDDEPRPPLVTTVDPPAHLTDAAKACWLELAPELVACRVLTRVDLPRLELLCVHLGAHRTLYAALMAASAAHDGTPVDLSRLTRALRAEAVVVKTLSSGFGMDPADRARLHVGPPLDADDPFLEFDADSKWCSLPPRPSPFQGLLQQQRAMRGTRKPRPKRTPAAVTPTKGPDDDPPAV